MAQVSAMLEPEWPQPQGQFSSMGSPHLTRTPPGTRSTSWELEYEFHSAAARTAELRQLIAEREAQWDGFVSARPMEPHEALRTYKQQQVLLHALRKEADWLRQALCSERRSLSEPGIDGGCPVDFPGGRQLARDVAIAWSPNYAQAWTGAADCYGQMMRQYATMPAALAPTDRGDWHRCGWGS